ncbi:FBXW7 [Symbiodinium pilosum]|uniref:FBXW7 protein n=1 Tax=Symbiodinium pilosum TaxID=2952 RepID=A0A812X1F5_SYMPI|nr:FBXW7 [Symbiodinium pilosum]
MAVPGHKPSIDAALQVTVSDIAAKVLGVFHLKDDCQVAAVRCQLEETSVIPNFDVHLLCGGRVLEDTDLLAAFQRDHHVEITLLRSPQPCAVTGGSDGDFLVWNLRTGSCCRFLPFGETITCLSIDWNARIMLSGHADTILRLWDLDRGVCLRELADGSIQSMLRCVEFNWNAKVAVSGCAAFASCCAFPKTNGATLALWDLASGRYIQGFGSCGVRSLSVDWTSPGSEHALVNDDVHLRMFSLDSGCLLWEIASASPIQAMAVDWPAQGAVTAGSSVIKVWKLHGPRCIQEFSCDCTHVQELAMDWTSRRCIASGIRSRGQRELFCWTWNFEDGQCLHETFLGCGQLRCVAIDPYRQQCLCAMSDEDDNELFGDVLKLYDSVEGQPMLVLEGHTDHVMCGVLS